MTTEKKFVTGFRVVPETLPCGCKLKNRHGAGIQSHAIMLKDGTRICKCGKRWGFFTEIRQFDEVGLYATLKGVRLIGDKKEST